jgi:hypothetical protein
LEKAGHARDVYLGALHGIEVGSGTIEEKVAVGECARNRANLVWKLPGGVLQLLLYRQGTGHPNRGYYGPIHAGSGDTRTSPYGRWAATSRDPTIGDVVLADFVLSGSDFAKGADDQNGPNGLTYPYQKPIEQAKSRNYWVGPLPGINVWHTMLVKHMPYVSPDSMIGKMLVQQAIEGLKATEIYKNKAPDWSQVPICPPVFFTAQRVFALGIGTAISFLTLRHLTQTGFISPIS